MNDYPCSMHFQVLTLMLHQKTMRLIFNLDLDARAGIRTLVIDSPPFEEGIFELGPPKTAAVIPANQWKKVSGTGRP